MEPSRTLFAEEVEFLRKSSRLLSKSSISVRHSMFPEAINVLRGVITLSSTSFPYWGFSLAALNILEKDLRELPSGERSWSSDTVIGLRRALAVHAYLVHRALSRAMERQAVLVQEQAGMAGPSVPRGKVSQRFTVFKNCVNSQRSICSC
jgi:hypothetical protein